MGPQDTQTHGPGARPDTGPPTAGSWIPSSLAQPKTYIWTANLHFQN